MTSCKLNRNSKEKGSCPYQISFETKLTWVSNVTFHATMELLLSPKSPRECRTSCAVLWIFASIQDSMNLFMWRFLCLKTQKTGQDGLQVSCCFTLLLIEFASSGILFGACAKLITLLIIVNGIPFPPTLAQSTLNNLSSKSGAVPLDLYTQK